MSDTEVSLSAEECRIYVKALMDWKWNHMLHKPDEYPSSELGKHLQVMEWLRGKGC